MDSKEFLERYSRGKLGDEDDFVEWCGEFKFLEKMQEEFEELIKTFTSIRSFE